MVRVIVGLSLIASSLVSIAVAYATKDASCIVYSMLAGPIGAGITATEPMDSEPHYREDISNYNERL